MGRLLARFHTVAKPMAFAPFMSDERYARYHRIPLISEFSAAANKALGMANERLATLAIPGVVHGDFKEDNFFLYAEGVCDVENTFASTNVMTDFLHDRLDNNVEPALKGYADEIGQSIDPLLLPLTKISRYAHALSQASNKDGHVNDLFHLKRELHGIRDFTRYTPSDL